MCLRLTWSRFPRFWVFVGVIMLLMSNGASAEEESFLRRNQGESILFPIGKDFGNKTLSIEWNFLTENIRLIKLWPDQSKPMWINTQQRFKSRLFVHDLSSLRITNLTSKDSGNYEVHIKSVLGKVNTQNFILTVSGSNMKTCNPWLLLGSLVLVVIHLRKYIYGNFNII